MVVDMGGRYVLAASLPSDVARSRRHECQSGAEGSLQATTNPVDIGSSNTHFYLQLYLIIRFIILRIMIRSR